MENKQEALARRLNKARGEQADQPAPNRAQRRAAAKHQKSKQRRGQKAYDRQQKAERRLAVEAQRTLRRMGHAEETYWNGLPQFAVRGTAVVTDIGGHWLGYGDPEIPAVEHAAESPIGRRIPVVAVAEQDGTAYLYDEDGSGWRKVTEGKGSPAWPHRDVDIDETTFEVL